MARSPRSFNTTNLSSIKARHHNVALQAHYTCFKARTQFHASHPSIPATVIVAVTNVGHELNERRPLGQLKSMRPLNRCTLWYYLKGGFKDKPVRRL